MICTDFKFPMSLDMYYATENQDKYGMEDKSWQLDQTLDGYVEILGSVDKEALKTQMFNQYEDKLIGRTKVDPRLSLNGIYYPITSILVTNIRNTKTGEEYYLEAAGSREGRSTLYEIFAVEPYVNPWNQVEYWKILLNRSDTQVLDAV